MEVSSLSPSDLSMAALNFQDRRYFSPLFLAAGFAVTFAAAGLAGSFTEAELESSLDDSSFLTGALS